MRFLAALFLLAAQASLPAQVVRIANYGTTPFTGWHRCTIDTLPGYRTGTIDDRAKWVVGREIGLVAHVVDLHVQLKPGETRTLKLVGDAASGNADSHDPLELSEDEIVTILAPFGAPVVAGTELGLAPTSVGGRPNPLSDGAGYVVHWRGRPDPDAPMFHADVWLTVYPEQPWAVGEIVITASNPSVPAVLVDVPAHGFPLGWTSGTVAVVDDLPLGQPLFTPGERFCDGQARSFRFVTGRLNDLPQEQLQSALAASRWAVHANGIERPGVLGTTLRVPSRFHAPNWLRQHWNGARSRLHGWNAGPLGVAANSGQTGSQEDQGFGKGSEAYAPFGLGAEAVRYYVALGASRRPCNHLEPDGDHLAFDGHSPRLVFWSSRPHWHTGVSPNQLGKERQPWLPGEANGWNGPDREHWFANTTFAAIQWTGSPALQWQIEAHARTFWLQETVDPALSTSGADAARSRGWTSIMAANLWLMLENRDSAQRVADRYRARVDGPYRAACSGAGWWDVQTDPRVTQYVDTSRYPRVSMSYQGSFATMGIEIGASVLQLAEARSWAYAQALRVVEECYVQDSSGRWIGWEIVGIPIDESKVPLADLREGVSAHRTGWFEYAWLPCAVWTVLRHNPEHAKARAIWVQLQVDIAAGSAPNDWLPPLQPVTSDEVR